MGIKQRTKLSELELIQDLQDRFGWSFSSSSIQRAIKWSLKEGEGSGYAEVRVYIPIEGQVARTLLGKD